MTNPYAEHGISDYAYECWQVDPSLNNPDGTGDLAAIATAGYHGAKEVLETNLARLRPLGVEFLQDMDRARAALSGHRIDEYWELVERQATILGDLARGFIPLPLLAEGFAVDRATLARTFHRDLPGLSPQPSFARDLRAIELLAREFDDVVRRGYSSPTASVAWRVRPPHPSLGEAYRNFRELALGAATAVRYAAVTLPDRAEREAYFDMALGGGPPLADLLRE